MGSPGLEAAVAKMGDAGIDDVAIRTFAHYYRQLERGETGFIPEDAIEPVDIPAMRDADVHPELAEDALQKTVVIKLNGGLGTSMGMDRAKSLLCVRRGMSFLDIIARQVLHLRQKYDAPLPVLFMNSFRTSGDTIEALARYGELATPGLPLEFLQDREPRLLLDDLMPVTWPRDPELEWCPPGHGDIYPALRGSGLLDQLIELGYQYAFVSNSDNLGAVPDPEIAGWFAGTGSAFAIEAVRRTPSDRKGGHFARRRTDGRLILRETAQTLPEDRKALENLDRHRFCSTNNIWFDLRRMRDMLVTRDGVLGLPLIRNEKNVVAGDPATPKVVQIETAMGSAIEVFDDAQLIEVGRDRFVPVKTTNDLLVLRSDVYEIGPGFTLEQVAGDVPFVDLDADYYGVIDEFDKRFPDGAPSMRKASSLRISGDWTFGNAVEIIGNVALAAPRAQRVPAASVLNDEPRP
jgi:UTP--glucose-1-phosphate uridylyltransferase